MDVTPACSRKAAAKQLIQRMKLYDHEEGVQFDVKLVSALLGEHAPEDLDDFCHAVAMKETRSISLLRRLLVNQQVSDVQLHTWLAMRMNQLLMFMWHQSKGERRPAQAARLFGASSQMVPKEVHHWTAPELMDAIKKMTDTEKLLKGASVEGRQMVLERLVLDLITQDA
jgi:DNA polymerase III delta subunit